MDLKNDKTGEIIAAASSVEHQIRDQAAGMKFLSLADIQTRFHVFQEIQNSLAQQNKQEAKMLKINKLLQSVLDLAENENKQLKSSASVIDSYLAYRDLMIILIQYEMNEETWKEDLSSLSNEILSLYAKTALLSDLKVYVLRWSALAKVYQPEKMRIQIFKDLLDRIIDQLDNKIIKPSKSCLPITKSKKKKKKLKQNVSFDGEIKQKFFKGSEEIFQKFSNIIATKLHIQSVDDESRMAKINLFTEIFDVVIQIEEFATRQLRELKFAEILNNEIERVTINHLSKCVSHSVLREVDDDELQLSVMICAVKFFGTYFNDVVEEHLSAFERFPNYKFAENLYKIYDAELEEIIKPVICQISKRLKQGANAVIIMSAIKLYEELENFCKIGTENSEFKMKNYSEWFPNQIVTIINTPLRITKAIQKDESSFEFNDYKRTSSAGNSMEMIFTVIKFWEQFERAEEDEYKVLEYIANDLCRLALDYIDKYTIKIETDESEAENYRSIPIKMSIAIANFQYILTEMQSLLTKLIQNMPLVKFKEIMEIFKPNFKRIEDKMIETIKDSLKRFLPAFRKWTMESAVSEDNVKEFLSDIETILMKFKQNMKQKRFEQAKINFWHGIVESLPIIVQDAIDDNELNEFFESLNKIWIGLKEIFNIPIITDEMKTNVAVFEEAIDWYSLDSPQLLSRQYESQKGATTNTPTATIHCSFVGNKLIIEVLHAQKLNLIVKDSNCHSFISLKLFHGDLFNGTGSLKTKIQETHCPLYEETLEFELTDEQMKLKNTLVYFTLKRKLQLGQHETLGEAFLSFKEIPIIEGSINRPLRKEINFLKLSNSDDRQSMRILRKRGKLNDTATRKLLSEINVRDKPLTIKRVKSQMIRIIRSSISRSSKHLQRLRRLRIHM